LVKNRILTEYSAFFAKNMQKSGSFGFKLAELDFTGNYLFAKANLSDKEAFAVCPVYSDVTHVERNRKVCYSKRKQG